MRIVCGAILVATVMTSSAVAADVADDLSGAKWIGGNPVTLPDYDFGAAAWIAPKSGEAALTKTVVLAKRSGGGHTPRNARFSGLSAISAL